MKYIWATIAGIGIFSVTSLMIGYVFDGFTPDNIGNGILLIITIIKVITQLGLGIWWGCEVAIEFLKLNYPDD